MIRWGNNDVACLAKTETGSGAIAYALGVGDRLATYTGGSYSYDTAGCVTAIDRTGKPDLDLTWNGQYQLTSVSTNGIVAESYTYDPLGRRASTTSAGTTIRHVYNGIHCVADIDSVGNVVKSYTWGLGVDNLLAVTCHSGTLATTYYALTDLQGTVHGFADAGGNLVARYAYDAWGNLLDADVAVSALADNRYLFQGREYSWATGLTNFRLRWYDPATGRWLSKDPIGISGGLNLYAFCGDDPVNFRDPFGLCEEEEPGLGSTVASIGVGFIPIAGSLQSGVELLSGMDYITGEKTSRGLAAVGIIAGLCPGGKGALKAGSKLLAHADEAEALWKSRKAFSSANKLANKQVDDIARELDMTKRERKEFGKYIHELKRQMKRTGSENFSYEDLREHGKDFLGQ